MSFNAKKTRKTNESKIRIIAGQWRGRKLNVIDAPGLRPTGDRIKETLFNWLAPDIVGAECLDLFAGTGSLGLEALSRGAKFVQFVEFNRQAYQQLSDNLSLLKCDKAAVANSDAKDWLQLPQNSQFDLVFLDPPFQADLWQATIQAITDRKLLKSNSLIYVETPRDKTLAVPADWQIHRQKHAGQICATLYEANC